MDESKAKCNNCGYRFNYDWMYFSKDYACYYSLSPMFSLVWTFCCSHVSVYTCPWYLRIFGAPPRFKMALGMDEFRTNPYGRMENHEFGGFASLHLMRMIWHSLNERIKQKKGQENHEAAIHLALNKIPPFEVGLMVVATVNAPTIVPLEQQIQEGMYLKEFIDINKMRSWISTCPDPEASSVALESISHFLGGYNAK